MSMTRLTVYQGIYIFSTMSDKTRTKKLNISNNDLSLVPSEYISKGLNRLVEVDVCGTKLTDIQMTGIFIQMLDTTSIQKLALDGNVETGYQEFLKSLKDKVNVIVTFDKSQKTTTLHLFKKF